MFQESLNLSAGQRVRQCTPCSIIFKMKLFIAVSIHDDNVPHVYIAGEILFCQCAAKENIYSRFLCLIVLFKKFVFSISQLKMLVYCQQCTVFLRCQNSFVFLMFHKLKILAKANHKEGRRQ